MDVDANAPAAGQSESGAGVIKMTVRQHYGAGRRVLPQVFTDSAEHLLLISGSAGVYEHETFLGPQQVSIGKPGRNADDILSDHV